MYGVIDGEEHLILPVFAGMIPTLPYVTVTRDDSPRIRGDDPSSSSRSRSSAAFSPYSRG